MGCFFSLFSERLNKIFDIVTLYWTNSASLKFQDRKTTNDVTMGENIGFFMANSPHSSTIVQPKQTYMVEKSMLLVIFLFNFNGGAQKPICVVLFNNSTF